MSYLHGGASGVAVGVEHGALLGEDVRLELQLGQLALLLQVVVRREHLVAGLKLCQHLGEKVQVVLCEVSVGRELTRFASRDSDAHTPMTTTCDSYEMLLVAIEGYIRP